MRDESAQAAGPFASGSRDSKGSLLKHEPLIAFIQRNYQADPAGQWFFQNGPQRVYVELETTPWIWRISNDGSVKSHAGKEARVQRSLVDENGRFYLETDLGFGLVHTQDMLLVAEAVEQGRWLPSEVSTSELAVRFRFVQSPATGAR